MRPLVSTWEQRKFADFVTASGIRNSENLDLPSYSVTNNRGFVPQDEQFENGGTMREADKTSYWIVEPNSFAYNPARINVGSIGYQSTSGNVIVSSLYEVFRTDETCDDHFLWYWFKTRLFTQQIEMLQEGGVRLYFFFDKLLKSGISMPSVDEQRLIGEQFDWLDSLITLHQRKYDKLCTVKKSMLDKMFPKPGETEPEIRFEGFTDPWEQRKLGELCTFSKGHGYSKADIRDAGTPLILYGRLYTHYESCIEEVDTFTVEQDGSILSRGNEVIVPASGETAEDIAVASSVRRSGIILGGDLNVVTPTGKLDPDYTALAITYSKAHDDLAKRAQGKSVVHVHGNDIAEVEISYPSESEQKRISSVVLNLDSLITLHQRKLDLLKNTKKSLLDKMFV